jgi:hypothetical protein
VSTDDSAIQEALDDYNNRLAKTHDRNRRLVGWGLCAGAATSWAVSAFAAGSVLKDPAVAADLDSGTHIRDAAGTGWTSAVCGLLGLVLLLAAVWRGPSLTRWVSILMLLLGVVPVLWLAAFAFLLSV